MVSRYISSYLSIGHLFVHLKLNLLYKKLVKLFFALALTQGIVQAQSTSNIDSVEFAFLPAISYNSDLGFIGGGLTNWYKYREGMNPFYSYLSIAGIFSTKGLASFEIAIDKPNAFGSDIRLSTSFYTFRFLEDSYFGFRNYQEIENESAFPSNYFRFQSFSVGYNATLRFPIKNQSEKSKLEALAILNLDYETPFDNDSTRLFSIESSQLTGFQGGRTFQLGTGLIWESRDSEFSPTKGAYAEISLELGNTLWGSSFNNLIFKYEMRHYASFFLLKKITFANRISLKHTNGDVPYWKLAYAGDDETIRGYPSKRFLDDNVVVVNSELRTWLLDFPSVDTKLGGNLFFDVGRTFRNGAQLSDITGDLKYSFGFGGTASFFTPDFIIRGDLGFSKEGTGVYITTGYMF